MLHEIFTSLLDDILYERILEESLEQHQKELFQKKNDLVLKLPASLYEDDVVSKCFICYGDISKGESIYKLHCGHFYHEICLSEAIKHQHTTCPICRVDIHDEIKIENKINSNNEHVITYHEL